MKRALIAILLILSMAVSLAEGDRLSFSDATDLATLQSLDGQTVTITGYMATLSPIHGKYIYLMNLPYQSCPFCVPNTTQLSNTMAVYAKEGETFDYTDQAVRITGTMQIGDTTDEFGYVYNYRIVDAEYEIVDLSELTGDYALWYSIAEDGLVADINTMFDYLYFICQWTEYTATFEDENGDPIEAFLYPGDAETYLQDDGPYGYSRFEREGYFPSLIARVQAVSPTELDDLVGILEIAQAAAEYGRAELAAGNYTYDEANDKYILDNDAELYSRFEEPWTLFCEWLARWEM